MFFAGFMFRIRPFSEPYIQLLKETTGGEFRVYRASKRYIDLL